MSEGFKTGVVVISLAIVVFWGMLAAFTLPNREYLCKTTIEGRELCFHSNDGKYVVYYSKKIGIHNREGHFINDNETLSDDYEKIAEGYRFYNNLKCE